MHNKPIIIDEILVHQLITTQFPQWKNLSVRPVEIGGWDNRTFHLGDKMLVRLPSAAHYEAATEIWDTALATTWNKSPVWIHGDISAGNLLVQTRQLSAVIDFGQLAICDPACDLAIMTAADFTHPNNFEAEKCWHIIDDILIDYKFHG